MPAADPVPAGIVRRAATIARGPHPCPSCECPTWAEPPVPWTDLRDYVVRCDACERPISIRIDRDRVLRRGAVPAHLRPAAGIDAVDELLDTRGTRAFALRLVAAAALPVAFALLALALGASVPLALVAAAVAIVPGAAWAPSIAAIGCAAVASRAREAAARARRIAHRRPLQVEPVEVVAGRWDQWQREQKLRDRDRAEHPEALLRELERVLDERELRRVRLLAERGDVPAAHLDDLLRFRRAFVEPEREDMPVFLRSG